MMFLTTPSALADREGGGVHIGTRGRFIKNGQDPPDGFFGILA